MDLREKLETISYGGGNLAQRGLLGFGVAALASALGISLILYFDSPQTILLSAASMALVILWRPALGLALYLVVYPLVPAEESLNPLKIAVFGLFFLVFIAWFINKGLHREKFFSRPEYRWLYIFFLFLCFSPVLGIGNNFSVVDWARDIAPLLNLLLIPIMADYFGKRQNHWLFYLFFTLWTLSTVQNAVLLLAMYDVPLTGWVQPLFHTILLHPSLGVGLGLLMFLSKARRRMFWLIFGITNLATVFLTPGRTIWITTLTILLLIVVISFKKRLLATFSIGTLVVLMAFLFFQKGPSNYIESQRGRLQQLEEFRSDVSFENRVEEIKQTGKLFLSSPLWGVGFGYQYNFWRPFVTGIGPGFLDTNYTHNDIMYISSKGGLIGLSLFVLMLYKLVKGLFQRRKQAPGNIQSGVWTAIAIIALLNSLIIGLSTPVFQSRWGAFALATLLAMGLGYNETESSGRYA